ncbi:uncharacterized protein TA10145 [Theileria annulata]|uniref:SAC3/GANP/THP3 conserved domain-containing protein n=1 Tax=Theileria annulata TaxID=5874 RepID=Q4U8T7_THEAN|nr:uncharacterized protein TA10145 [Theileria annulata]CAI76766.1 hypothetical protein TA10145 [Theileria annulata]|eukprot:XP_953391.1 hypothetical protein TA10145 [Theileria annulata]
MYNEPPDYLSVQTGQAWDNPLLMPLDNSQLLYILLNFQDSNSFLTNDNSKSFIGRNHGMCSEKEYNQKVQMNTANDLERDASRNVNPKLTLKSFQRSDAFRTFKPEDVRPAFWCRRTIYYSLSHFVDADINRKPYLMDKPFGYIDVYNFLRDRLRSIWQDLTVQRCTKHRGYIESFEISIRFLIYSNELLSQNDEYDEKQNLVLLNTCLDKLMNGYDDVRASLGRVHGSNPLGDGKCLNLDNRLYNLVLSTLTYMSPHEAEFWSYRLLLLIPQILTPGSSATFCDTCQRMPVEIKRHPLVKYSISSCLAAVSGNVYLYFKLMNNPKCHPLQAALMNRFSSCVRIRFLFNISNFKLVKDSVNPLNYDTLTQLLGYEDLNGVVELLQRYNVNASNVTKGSDLVELEKVDMEKLIHDNSYLSKVCGKVQTTSRVVLGKFSGYKYRQLIMDPDFRAPSITPQDIPSNIQYNLEEKNERDFKVPDLPTTVNIPKSEYNEQSQPDNINRVVEQIKSPEYVPDVYKPAPVEENFLYGEKIRLKLMELRKLNMVKLELNNSSPNLSFDQINSRQLNSILNFFYANTDNSVRKVKSSKGIASNQKDNNINILVSSKKRQKTGEKINGKQKLSKPNEINYGHVKSNEIYLSIEGSKLYLESEYNKVKSQYNFTKYNNMCNECDERVKIRIYKFLSQSVTKTNKELGRKLYRLLCKLSKVSHRFVKNKGNFKTLVKIFKLISSKNFYKIDPKSFKSYFKKFFIPLMSKAPGQILNILLKTINAVTSIKEQEVPLNSIFKEIMEVFSNEVNTIVNKTYEGMAEVVENSIVEYDPGIWGNGVLLHISLFNLYTPDQSSNGLGEGVGNGIANFKNNIQDYFNNNYSIHHKQDIVNLLTNNTKTVNNYENMGKRFEVVEGRDIMSQRLLVNKVEYRNNTMKNSVNIPFALNISFNAKDAVFLKEICLSNGLSNRYMESSGMYRINPHVVLFSCTKPISINNNNYIYNLFNGIDPGKRLLFGDELSIIDSLTILSYLANLQDFSTKIVVCYRLNIAKLDMLLLHKLMSGCKNSFCTHRSGNHANLLNKLINNVNEELLSSLIEQGVVHNTPNAIRQSINFCCTGFEYRTSLNNYTYYNTPNNNLNGNNNINNDIKGIKETQEILVARLLYEGDLRNVLVRVCKEVVRSGSVRLMQNAVELPNLSKLLLDIIKAENYINEVLLNPQGLLSNSLQKVINCIILKFPEELWNLYDGVGDKLECYSKNSLITLLMSLKDRIRSTPLPRVNNNSPRSMESKNTVLERYIESVMECYRIEGYKVPYIIAHFLKNIKSV